jgi:hypothetical protein
MMPFKFQISNVKLKKRTPQYKAWFFEKLVYFCFTLMHYFGF